MVVVLDTLSAGSGGALTYVSNMIPRLAGMFAGSSDRHRLCIVSHERHVNGFDLDSRVQVICPRRKDLVGLSRAAWEWRRLPDICSSLGADVLFVPNQVSPWIPRFRSVLMLRNMEPFVSGRYPYSLRGRLRNVALSHLTPRCLRRASRVIAVSDHVASFATAKLGIRQERVVTIPHGRDLRFGAERDPDDRQRLECHGIDRPFVLVSGSLLPYKRVEDVIAAWRIVASRQPVAPQLVVAGSSDQRGYVEMLHECARSNGVTGSLRFLGQVVFSEMAGLYRNALALVMSTEAEACPNVAIEALSSGCPIVASDIPFLRAVLRDAALYYAPRDAQSLADVLSTLIEDPGLRARHSAACLVESRRFDWDATAAKTFGALTRWD